MLPLLVIAAAAWVFLPTRPASPQSAGMKTLSKPARAKPARKLSVLKSIKRRQTRAQFVAEVKAIAGRIDAGTERMYSAEEVKRELGL